MSNAADIVKADAVDNVENALYNHMLRNAFQGFLKSAVIAGAIGALLGAVLFGCGILSPMLIVGGVMETCGGSAALAGALMGVATFMLPAGGFGAVAGINSARDARRYLLSHEADNQHALIPAEMDEVKVAASSLERKEEHEKPEPDWRRKLGSKAAHISQLC